MTVIFKNRPYTFRATLAQRFSASILDIGLLLVALVIVAIVHHLLSDMPIELKRPRYVPPHPDMGWQRIMNSALFFSGILIVIAGFVASPLQATPGMLAFHLQVKRSDDTPPHFTRALLWTGTAYLPLLAANFLLLYGIAVQKTVIHLYTFNLFSLMVILQSALYLTSLIRKDKAAVHDILCDIKVDHYEERETGLHPIRKAFMYVVLVILLCIVFVTGGISLINIKDAPLDIKVEQLRAVRSESGSSKRFIWRENAPFEIDTEMNNALCASSDRRMHAALSCPEQKNIESEIKEYAPLIDLYWQDIKTRDADLARLHEKYLNFESVTLTDLALADLIMRHENDGGAETLSEWLALERFWRRAIQEPGYLFAQSKALLHYNHILLSLPALLNHNPALIDLYWPQINDALKTIVFDEDFVRQIMAHEYDLYESLLSASLIDYFPLIQPNHTRNQFVPVAEAVEELFSLDEKTMRPQHELVAELRRKFKWNTLYNPLGLRFRDLTIKNVSQNLHVITAYHSNNALKKMLKIYVEARRLNIPRERMGLFLDSLPDENRTVLLDTVIQWDPAISALYYTPPGLPGLRRLLLI